MSEKTTASADKKTETQGENSVSPPQKSDSSQLFTSPVDRILFLQRTIGNQAVGKLIKSGALQTKLRISELGDIYEQEADRVAEQVMRMPEPEVLRNIMISGEAHETLNQSRCPKCAPFRTDEGDVFQPKEAAGSPPEVTPGLEADINAIRGGGEPLPESVRAFFEPRFGYDFSQVRVHTDAKATESARVVNAQAYTVRQDIVFDAERYEPGTPAGRSLLTHELVHTIQQKPGSQAHKGFMQGGGAEQEAKLNEKAISQGLPLLNINPQPVQVARRSPDAGATGPSNVGVASFRDQQVACIIRLGGCASSRSAGIPTPDEITSYNQSCRSESTYTGPDITPSNEECANPPRPPAIPSALIFARSLATRYPGWLSVLPNCPCTDSEARANPSMWKGPDACMPRYHPGAASGYRSASGYASVPGTSHGQQCCYDGRGALITEGGAAGTPDTVAPIGLFGIINHYFDDVRTFNALGWETYNQYWVPNNGNSCPANRKP